MPAIHQLVYVSIYNSGRIDSPLSALTSIVKVSRSNNQRDGITGYLIFDGASFLQILEGETGAVRRTFERIAGDPRHRDTRIVGTRDVGGRSFARWSMDGYLRSPQDSAIFARHGVTGSVAHAALSVDDAIELTLALAGSHAEAR